MAAGTLFSTIDLAELRDMTVSAQPDTASILRKQAVPDDAGGTTITWTTVATVSARVATLGRLPKESLIAERLTGVDLWAILLPQGTDVRNDDRIAVTFADGETARTYEVKGLATEGSWAPDTRVIVAEVK